MKNGINFYVCILVRLLYSNWVRAEYTQFERVNVILGFEKIFYKKSVKVTGIKDLKVTGIKVTRNGML